MQPKYSNLRDFLPTGVTLSLKYWVTRGITTRFIRCNK